ncbi:MAG: putative Membrane protein, partial [Parcubacteria group bacterium Athens0416_74]
VGGVILIGLISCGAVYTEYFKTRNAFLIGNFSVVEGEVRDYKAGTNQKGSAYDDFCVKEVCFVVSDWEVTGGFHQMQINGSPLKDGLPVRISYVGDTIIRLEIAIPN